MFDKFEEWNFPVIKYPHVDSNAPVHQPSGIVKGQLYRYRIICNSIKSFKLATQSLVSHMLMRGHTLRDLFKGWSSHLAYFHQDKITNYPKLKMWFKRMTYWVMKSQRVTGKLAPPPVDAQPTTVLSQSNMMTSPISDVC